MSYEFLYISIILMIFFPSSPDKCASYGDEKTCNQQDCYWIEKKCQFMEWAVEWTGDEDEPNTHKDNNLSSPKIELS